MDNDGDVVTYKTEKGVKKISKSTRDRYLLIVKTIISKTTESLGLNLRDPNPLEMANWLMSNVPNYRPKSFNLYRAALLWWLSEQIQDDYIVLTKDVLSIVPKDGYKGVKPGETATIYSNKSSRKRTFRKKDFEKLIKSLADRSSKSANDGRMKTNPAAKLSAWLFAGLASGLRPAEWEHARWDESKENLIVRTAKFKAEEVSPLGYETKKPKERIVPIEKEDRFMVDNHLLYVRQHLNSGRTFKSYYANVKKYLREVCLDVFGREVDKNGKPLSRSRFTLYMMRGQFGANRKWSKGAEAAAREMGCSLPIVYGCYGQRIHAHRGNDGQLPNTHKQREIEKQKQLEQEGKKAFDNKGFDLGKIVEK